VLLCLAKVEPACDFADLDLLVASVRPALLTLAEGLQELPFAM